MLYNMLGRFFIFQNFTNTTYAQEPVLPVPGARLEPVPGLVLVQELVPVLLPLSWQAQPLSFLAPMGSRPT